MIDGLLELLPLVGIAVMLGALAYIGWNFI